MPEYSFVIFETGASGFNNNIRTLLPEYYIAMFSHKTNVPSFVAIVERVDSESHPNPDGYTAIIVHQ